ncbi:subtilisin-like protein [Myriangium duriaei CBS 260.36]|uniref:Subtilisin-like protein n=1 Tax=Myriangium duriaei CBS 260.36 TaxID=1168546 RepID=A0A9P4MSM1_9PEZI|nr:subtilisin-like protein [Myriangium duriaei CBS 260.36]
MISIFLLFVFAAASAASLSLLKAVNPTDKYLVTLKPEADLQNNIQIAQKLEADAGKKGDGKHYGVSFEYSIDDFHGYVGHFRPSVVQKLKGLQDVDTVEPDQVWRKDSYEVQSDAQYGLRILSSNNPHILPGKYYYDKSAGAGTYGYVIDTGIWPDHSEFAGGRVTLGYNAIPGAPFIDDDGHGTHAAGIMGGHIYGVAKKTELIAVKVIHKDTTTSALWREGFKWAVKDIVAKKPQAKEVINISIGGGYSKTVNKAVNAAYGRGRSPASASGVIAVAAIDSTRKRWSYSKYGPKVALFAPGVDLISSHIGKPDATAMHSGTSGSAPFVSGLVLYLKGMYNLPNAKVTKAKLLALAAKGQVKGLLKNSTDLIAYNGSGM